VIGNGTAGVLFRQEAEAMGAHRNVFENNRILDNGAKTKGGSAQAAIVIQGHHHDLSSAATRSAIRAGGRVRPSASASVRTRRA